MAGDRTGATRVADVPTDIVAQLNAGLIETVTLAETLATNFAALFTSVFGDLPADDLATRTGAGVTVRMATAGSLLAEHATATELAEAGRHRSDIVRGWAAYACAHRAIDLETAIDAMRPFAADHHFGVREWGWLCVRPRIVAEPLAAIDHLAPWALDPDANIRRFSVEAIRPRGVWATHIDLLKTEPAHALAVLDPVCADSDAYVHRSVGNWMRDAAKTKPDWVADTCVRWALVDSDGDTIARIRKRALG